MITGRTIGAFRRMATNVSDNLAVSRTPSFYNNKEWAIFIAMKLRDRRKSIEETRVEPEPEKWKPFSFLSNYLTSEHFGQPFTSEMYRKRYKKMLAERVREDQLYIPERHKILGSDLAAAHFTLPRGARLRFRGQTEWMTGKDVGKFPNVYDSSYQIEALEMHEFDILYEGLDNILELAALKWLSFSGCKSFDDWYLDKISSEYPALEHLDISDCERVTERGLECLYRMPYLKTLVVTNYHNSTALDLTCFLLEDINPYLKVEIKYPNKEKS